MEIPLEVAQFRYVSFHRSVWIEFIVVEIENRKYCSKIIFKCMNSTVRSIFNIFKCINSVIACVNSDFCLYTVNSCDFTVYALKKKKKTITLKLKRAKRASKRVHIVVLYS